MSQEEAKKEIQNIINDFKADYQKHRKELEANTETKLIEPLFKALGWTSKDFVKQEKAHRGTKTGHADYAFYIDGRIVFFLEVKKIGVYLEKEADKQVISYALSKRIPFAVSTNFEQLRIFCVEQEKPLNNKFRVFDEPEDYINRFHDLWLLSKENFEQNATLKIAESEGRLKRRVSIDKALLEDLMHIRKLIAYDIEKNYPDKYDINEKDDIIQRIIDRLIFIRRCEDVNINPENIILLEEIRVLPDNKAYPKLKQIFAKYDNVYNAGLFAKAEDNDCDKIDINGRIIKDLAYYLYESKNKEYIYNFSWIDADVLGQVYEQYLGIILAQTKSGRAKLKEGQLHRKEHGIYYTPIYVVDYIVKNTIQKKLDDKKTKPEDIKILDPSCGSGSFLIKSFDCLYNKLSSSDTTKQHRIDTQGTYSIKTEILKKNLFGVDLDNKAVEITKLNLLLKAAEGGRKLPDELDKHIRQGNSLIDNKDIAGLNAFIWDNKFQEGSFDVVIGNPPYINAIQLTKIYGNEVRTYWKDKFYSAKGTYDIYILFFEQSLKLCKEGGYVSFITPNKYLSSPYGKALRELITKKYKLIKILDLSQTKVFEDPSVYPIVTVFQNVKPTKDYDIEIERLVENGHGSIQSYKVSSKNLNILPENLWGLLVSKNINLLEKIFDKSSPLQQCAEVQATSTAAEADEFSNYISEGDKGLPILNSGTIDRYSTTYGFVRFMNKGKKLFHPKIDMKKINETRKNLYNKPKIIFAKLALVIEGFFDVNGGYASINTNCVHSPKEDYPLHYLAGLLNSKLMSFIYSELFSGLRMSGGYYQFQAPQLRILPIKDTSKSNKEKISSLVNQIVELNKNLNKIEGKKTAESKKIEDEIKRIEVKIDEIVYSIYGITNKEKEIIENSV